MKHLLFAFALSMPIYAQLPEAPKAHIDKTEIALLGIDSATRALDVYSTHQMLENGGHEVLLPRFVADHTPAMAFYSAGTVGLDWFIARRLGAARPPRTSSRDDYDRHRAGCAVGHTQLVHQAQAASFR